MKAANDPRTNPLSQNPQKITKLTPVQQELLADFRDSWRAIANSTAPADRSVAEQGIGLAYHRAQLRMPTIVWCQSPLSMALTIRFFGQLHHQPEEARVSGRFWQCLKEVVGKGLIEDIRAALSCVRDKGVLEAFEESVQGAAEGDAKKCSIDLGKCVFREVFEEPQTQAWRDIFHMLDRPFELRDSITSQLWGHEQSAMNDLTWNFGSVWNQVLGDFGGRRLSWSENQSPIWFQIMQSAQRLITELDEKWANRYHYGWNEPRRKRSEAEALYKRTLGRIPLPPVDPEVACQALVDDVLSLIAPDSDYLCLGDYGLHRIGSLAFWDYCSEVFDLDDEAKLLEGLWMIARNAGWCLPYQHYCFVCDRPISLVVDALGRLHNADGPAIKYSNGWSVYAWLGVAVPEHVILHPESLTATKIMQERNVEVRRVMVERMGLERFLADSGAIEIHRDDFGILYRHEIQHRLRVEQVDIVMVTNKTAEVDGTYKKYIIRVPPEMTRAKEAIAWTFGMTEEEYCPDVET